MRPARIEPAAHRVPDGLGLLEDLFQHEVFVATTFGRGEIPIDVDGLELDLLAVEVPNAYGTRRHLGHLVVIQRDDVTRVIE